MVKIIEDRENIVNEGHKNISHLIYKLEDIIIGSEQEYLFHIVNVYPNIFTRLAQDTNFPQTYKIDWLRATTGLTIALNNILPKHLPLKHPNTYNIKKMEDTFKKDYFKFVMIVWRIGQWQYFLENGYVDKIKISEKGPKTFYSEDTAQAFEKYAAKVFNFSQTNEYQQWQKLVYKNLPRDVINDSLMKEYGFTLEDLGEATQYLEDLVNKNQVYIHGNQLHAAFTKNMRSGRADNLFNFLKFGEGRDLRKSPLIPVKGGEFLIAQWICELRLLFDAWVRPLIEQNYSMLVDFVGPHFEKQLEDEISKHAEVKPNKIISEDEFEIQSCLREMKKAQKFEIDLVAVKGEYAFLISCKGGRKDLPRLFISMLWGEIPEKDICSRININKKDCKEMDSIYKCVSSSAEIKEHLGIEDKVIIPIAVYSSPQPLGLPEIGKITNTSFKTQILTFGELVKDLSTLA